MRTLQTAADWDRRLRIPAVFLFGLVAIVLIRDTLAQGQDFVVFWRSARHLITGDPVYSLARDQAMSFKYPPWVVPFFLPLGLLSLTFAKGVWGLVQVLSLAGVFYWLRRAKVSYGILLIVGLSFFGIFAVHALDGQISLTMLVLSLFWGHRFFYSLRRKESFRFFVGVFLALSVKVISVFPLIALLPKVWRIGSLRQAMLVLFSVGALSFPVLYRCHDGSPSALGYQWFESTRGASHKFIGDKTLSRDNQGFVGLMKRKFQLTKRGGNNDLYLSLFLCLVFSVIWGIFGRKLAFTESWVGWLGLVAVVHPLSWFHSFVFAFPLAVLSVDRAFKSRDRLRIAVSFVGVAAIAVITEKTMGDFGAALEMNSIKSWGVLLSLASIRRGS